MAVAGRAVLAWSLWWVTLFWWWMLLAGEWNHEEWIAAAAGAALGATVGEACRRCAELELRFPWALAGLPSALAMVLVDFAIVTGVLVADLARLRRPRGPFVHRRPSFEVDGLGPESVTRRAVTILVSGYSPNAYVVDVRRADDRVVLHDLVRLRKSEEPA
jgi:hypothetical protein